MSNTITLPFPDDFHVHLRDADALAFTVPAAAKQFARITVMPNLVPPVADLEAALAYQQRITAHIPKGSALTPLMVLYLKNVMDFAQLQAAKAAGIVGFKLYPQGVTTNSEQGAADLSIFDEQFAMMAELGLMLLIHGESADKSLDIFARESVFLTDTLPKILSRHPKLKIVLEHITTKQAVDFISDYKGEQLAATITPQHLLANRNDLLSGGIKPHYYCLPILKTEDDRKALLQAATSGNPRFFLGTDSAPHAQAAKESACGCAGCYSMPYALEYYAQAFDSIGKIEKLPDFASRFGATFYGLSINTTERTLIKKPQTIAHDFDYSGGKIIPFMAGQTLAWQIADAN